ncbi:MAG: sterol desaturase family protein [Bacteroidota bacterium]|nr:sterol desaturase family protein [Bacteroidota bacterium]MDP3144504.1 sterol desaturase family protein [Bacteroidota bacterium]MDP3555815.1 sterol desaturase family protein [Bacteroidota bacterium]
MNEFRESLLVLISVPIYAIVIGFEFFYSYFKNKGLYTGKGLLSNIYLTSLNMGLDILIRGLCLLILNYFFKFSIYDWNVNPIIYWTALVFAEDFMYYWLHRIDHVCRLFWAVHVTHHNSEEFNFTVGFRSSVFQPLYRFVYFIPLALLGFKGIDIMFIYSATQIFGILAHTQTINKLGFLEYIIITPSHHRVHHGSNVRYLDKNMGMLFVFWDKLFGTFQAEDETDPVVYGLTENIKTYNPFTMVFHEWKNIFIDLKKKSSFKDKLMYVFGPPGWSHDGSKKTSSQLRTELKNKSNH